MRRTLLLALGTAALAALFLTVLLRDEPSLRRPLLDTDFIAEPHVKDVVSRDGTVLAGTFRGRLERDNRPVILRGTVHVPAGADATVPAGTVILADRDAQIVVEGSLRIEMSSWASNRLHPAQRFWHGIVVRRGGNLTVQGATIRDATAALTCAGGGTLAVADSTLADNVAGIVTMNGSACTIERTRISGGRVGVHVLGGSPEIRDVTFARVWDSLRIFHNGRPTLSNLTFDHPGRAVITYAAEPPLRVAGMRIIPPLPLSDLVLDGADAPTHHWEKQEFPTGRVTVTPASR